MINVDITIDLKNCLSEKVDKSRINADKFVFV